MTSLFSYLHEHLQVSPHDDDQVRVTVVLPSDLFLDYLRILDSLTSFARTLRTKSKLVKPYVPDQHALDMRDEYYRHIVALFDRYTGKGLKRTPAIKHISADLRKENHPWSCPDLIRSSLIAAGRPGRPGRKSC